MSMPVQKPGKSKQDYGTPIEFLDAVRNRLKIRDFSVDLAASAKNAVAKPYYDEAINSLDPHLSWNPKPKEWAWLNPPYGKIAPWAQKAAQQSEWGAHIVMLVPASVGSKWWLEYVQPFAYVSFLYGRLTFVGAEDPYPKDCALLLYTPWQFAGNEIWHWRNSVPQLQQPGSGEGEGVLEMSELSF
jgi:phage N-6-adenine-methyltransferase